MRRRGHRPLQATRGDDSFVVDRYGDARNGRAGTGRQPEGLAPGHEAALHVGIHGRYHLAPRHSGPGRGFHWETFHAPWHRAQGSRRPGWQQQSEKVTRLHASPFQTLIPDFPANLGKPVRMAPAVSCCLQIEPQERPGPRACSPACSLHYRKLIRARGPAGFHDSLKSIILGVSRKPRVVTAM